MSHLFIFFHFQSTWLSESHQLHFIMSLIWTSLGSQLFFFSLLSYEQIIASVFEVSPCHNDTFLLSSTLCRSMSPAVGLILASWVKAGSSPEEEGQCAADDLFFFFQSVVSVCEKRDPVCCGKPALITSSCFRELFLPHCGNDPTTFYHFSYQGIAQKLVSFGSKINIFKKNGGFTDFTLWTVPVLWCTA